MSEYVIFSNYPDSYDMDEMRDWMFSNYADDYGWESIDDISDDEVWNEIYYQQDDGWDDFRDSFSRFINKSYFVLVGSMGRWNGSGDGGMLINSFNDLCDFWRDCAYIEFKQTDDGIKIRCTHHDGTNYGLLREITADGREYIDEHYWDDDSETIEEIANNEQYSVAPHFEW